MPKRQLQICLSEWDARLIIEALKELEAKWQHINETSHDEDEQAEYGNDLAALFETKSHFTQAATQVFGESVATFDRTSIG